MQQARTAAAALDQYTTGLIKRFVQEPGDGMLSKLVHDDGPDGPMTPKEAVGNAMLLLIAGHDSTVNTISHCVLTVLRNPGSFELLRRRPELIPGAIEEVLRLESAVQFFPSRSATADIEIDGTIIPKGSPVRLMYGAANRDPRAWQDPDRFDIRRRAAGHVGLGSGIHACVGAALARLAGELLLTAMARQLTSLELAGPVTPQVNNTIKGLAGLPVRVRAA